MPNLWFEDQFDEVGDTNLDVHTSITGQTYSQINLNMAHADLDAVVKGGLGYVEANRVGAGVREYSHIIDAVVPEADFDMEFSYSTNTLNVGETPDVGIFVRSNLAGTEHYQIRIDGDSAIPTNHLRLDNVVAGSATTIASANVPWVANQIHRIRVVLRGSNIKIFFDCNEVININNSAHPGTGGDNYAGITILADDTVVIRMYDLNVSLASQLFFSVEDHFDGPNGKLLTTHITNTGQAWQKGNKGFIYPFPFGGSSSYSSPFELDGSGKLVMPFQAGYMSDSAELIYSPRTKDYEIGMCFSRSSSPNTGSDLYILWRDTTETYSGGRNRRDPSQRPGYRYELFLTDGGRVVLRRNLWGNITTLGDVSGKWALATNNFLQIINIGTNIKIKINGITVFNVNDNFVSQKGVISLNVYGRAFVGNYAEGYWTVNYFYVDDSYQTTGNANRALVFSEKLKGRESLEKFQANPDSRFITQNEVFHGGDFVFPATKVEPTTKDVFLNDNISVPDFVKELLKNENCDATFQVGSFVANTSAGNQNVAHTLGENPKFCIAWAEGVTAGAWEDHSFFIFGFYDGVTNACVGATLENGAGTSDTYRAIRNSLIYRRSLTGSVINNGSITSWDTTQFTINWATANADPLTICFLIVGGPNVQAKVGNFTTLNTTGDKAITGVGFSPDAYMLGEVGGSISGFPQIANSGILGIGWADKAGNQGVIEYHDIDAAPTTDCAILQLTDAVQVGITSGGTNFRKASHVSMDSDGFTINYSLNFAELNPVIYLAIKGLSIKIGAFNKSTGGAPASQALTGFGFTPGAILFRSFQRTATATGQAGAYHGLGGYDGTNERAQAHTSQDNVTTSNVDSILKTDKVFIKANNATRTIDAEADGSSLDTDGVTISWSTNDAVATQILYMALGELNCNKNIINLSEGLLASDQALRSGNIGISLLERAETNDFVDNSGINKIIELTEFFEGAEILYPSLEFSLSDGFSVAEVIGRSFEFAEMLTTASAVDVQAVLNVVDTSNLNDILAVMVFRALSDGMTVTEAIQAIQGLHETFTLGDVVQVLNLTTKQDLASFGEMISITRSGPAESTDPDEIFQVDRSTHFVV